MKLEFQDVGVTYRGGHVALTDINLALEPGLIGLLGPNGAGKTTLMRVACTLLAPTRGRLLVDGADAGRDALLLRRRLGYLPQEWGAPRAARCREVVRLHLGLRGVPRARLGQETDRLLDLVGLAAVGARKAGALSGGMLRRLGVAQALAGEPELLVLDEPTVGLDPDERVAFRALLAQLGRDRTILLSTHVVADIGSGCGRVVLLDGGRVVGDAPPRQHVEAARGRVFEAVVSAGLADELNEGGSLVSSWPVENGVRVRVVGAAPAGLDASPAEPTLEDAYLLAVGHRAGFGDGVKGPRTAAIDGGAA